MGDGGAVLVQRGEHQFNLQPGLKAVDQVDGHLRLDGKLPTNPHGGNLAEAYAHGMTHVFEAVNQLRGTSHNQLPAVENVLVIAGASPSPSSGMILSAGRE